MTKRKSTKSALFTSVLALFLCFSMLLGTTYAWFTDSVTSGSNIIQSGTLDVDLVDAAGNSMEGQIIEFVTADNRAQNEILWEPGCTYATEPVYVVNKGNLALKYEIIVNGIAGNAKLLEAIEWTVTVGATETALADLKGTLAAGVKSEAIVLNGHMKEDAGNEYQGLTAEGISISVIATQNTVESDSIDDQYDKDAGYDQGKTNVGPYKLNVLSGGNAIYDGATKTYNVAVNTVAQGGYNATQGGKYFAGYTVNVAGYGENATVSFDKADGSGVTVWKLADEERDGFINNGVHQQWTRVGRKTAYRYDIDGDGVTDFTVINDASEAKIEAANAEELTKIITNGGNVVLVADITVDKWIMFSETKTIGNGQIITVKMDGLTIDGNGHTLTVNSIESAGNGNLLFDDASNLNISNLTIKRNCAGGAIGLVSGVIRNVNFVGGGYGIHPGAGEVTVENCTFATADGDAIYFEQERDNLTVTGCTFNQLDGENVILLRGDVKFTNNTINSGRTVNIVSGSPVVTGNNFNNVRLKVYEAATATVSDNTINNLEFQTTNYYSTFVDNTLSTEAQAALDAATKLN